MHTYILEDGKIIAEPDPTKWAQWMHEYGHDRHIGYTEIQECTISTVFLGIDHNFHGGDSPVLFETMIFGGEFNQEMVRTCTLEEAKRCHQDAVDFVSKKLLAAPKHNFLLEK